MSDPIVAKPLSENEPIRGFTANIVHIDEALLIPRKPRVFLTLVAGPGSLVDIKELIGPIHESLDGICSVYHGNPTDDEAEYLEAMRGAGKVVYLPYVGRHDLSRQICVHCGAIQDGDVVFQSDVLERPHPRFVADIKKWGWYITLESFNALFFHGKILLYRYHESISFEGTPHEGFRRLDGQLRAVDIKGVYPNEADVRANVRPLKRTDPFHWVGHYVRYYLSIPWGGNHCLLGNEHRGDPMTLYREREALRIEVRDYLRAQGVLLTDKGLKTYLLTRPLTIQMAEYINYERILNDAYRYWVLGDKTVKDDHTWTGMIKVEIPAIPLDTGGQPG